MKAAAEKGNFEKKVGEKTGPRANEEKVAKMAAEEAIAKLQQLGVKESGSSIIKPAVETQVTQQQATQQQNQQKQR